MTYKPCINDKLAVLALALGLSACQGGGRDQALAPALLFETPQDLLDAALNCDGFEHPDTEPVLLVHGTFTYGEEQYSWNYRPWLREQGFDVCVVSYPDRGFGDQQISAEYVANAVLRMHEMSGGRMIDMIGHSQGASMPRWAIKFWPEVRAVLDDFIMQAAPNHGTEVAAAGLIGLPLVPEAFYQFAPDSNFVTVMNLGDETPGEIDYTSIYTLTDELVQPQLPVSTSVLEPGQDNPRLSNIAIQDVCPLWVVDHVTIGTTDGPTALLTLDALRNDGPADIERAGGSSICLFPTILAPGTSVPGLFAAGAGFATAIPDGDFLVGEEPPLKPYAQRELDMGADAAGR